MTAKLVSLRVVSLWGDKEAPTPTADAQMFASYLGAFFTFTSPSAGAALVCCTGLKSDKREEKRKQFDRILRELGPTFLVAFSALGAMILFSCRGMFFVT